MRWILSCLSLKMTFARPQQYEANLRDFRLPLRSSWELRYSGLWNRKWWQIYYRRFGTTYQLTLRSNPEERISQDAIFLVFHEVSNGNAVTFFTGRNNVDAKNTRNSLADMNYL
jgi:hypothetical protein